MTEIDRRRFLESMAVAVPATALAARSARSPTGHAPATLDESLLHALSQAVLPSELPIADTVRVVTAFIRWLDRYRAGAERDHGYGTGALTRVPEHSRSRWADQLEELDREARERLRTPFAQLSRDQRQLLVRSALAGESMQRFPDPEVARHVAVALLAFFYRSPEATDRCYRARIQKHLCRPLVRSPERPAPLDMGADR